MCAEKRRLVSKCHVSVVNRVYTSFKPAAILGRVYRPSGKNSKIFTNRLSVFFFTF